MSTEDGLSPDHPLPPFLAHRPEWQGIQEASERAVTSSRAFKASILIAAAMAAGITVLSAGDPVTLFAAVTASLADVRASLVGNSGLQPDTDQPVSTIQSTADALASVQSTADAQALPSVAKEAPPRDESTASEPAGKDQAEASEPTSEALFRQYQTWAAEQDAPAKVRPVQPGQETQVAQNASARVAENASVPHRLMQKHRHLLPVHAARAEHFRKKVRRVQSARAEPAPTQSARVERPPIQDARAQSPAVQNAQAPSFLPIFGLRN
jgi:hypothetical protein